MCWCIGEMNAINHFSKYFSDSPIVYNVIYTQFNNAMKCSVIE